MQKLNMIDYAILRAQKLGREAHVSTGYDYTEFALRISTDNKHRRIKLMNVVMEPQLTSCQRRASNMRQRWISITNKRRIISSGRITPRVESRTIPLTCMGSL